MCVFLELAAQIRFFAWIGVLRLKKMPGDRGILHRRPDSRNLNIRRRRAIKDLHLNINNYADCVMM